MVTRDYPPRLGGMATYVEALAHHLRSMGVEVDLFVGSGNLRTSLLARSRRLKGFDIIHVASAPYAGLCPSRRLVVTVLEPIIYEWAYYRIPQKLEGIVARWMEKRALAKALRVIAISEATKAKLLSDSSLPGERVVAIPLGVDVERFRPENRREDGLVLMVGRLDGRKNVGEALEAASKLGARVRLLVVGDGPQRGRLEAMARALGVNVRFLGAVSPEDLPHHYGAAGIFLSTSRSEGFGLSLLEAMASGCAVVASDIPAHRELVSDGVDGLLYRGLSDLVEKLDSLLVSPDLKEKLGRQARKKALEFSWAETARRTLKVYEEVAYR